MHLNAEVDFTGVMSRFWGSGRVDLGLTTFCSDCYTKADNSGAVIVIESATEVFEATGVTDLVSSLNYCW